MLGHDTQNQGHCMASVQQLMVYGEKPGPQHASVCKAALPVVYSLLFGYYVTSEPQAS